MHINVAVELVFMSSFLLFRRGNFYLFQRYLNHAVTLVWFCNELQKGNVLNSYGGHIMVKQKNTRKGGLAHY